MPDKRPAHSPFWVFSLSVYRKNAFSAACLSLQDARGLDVNFLLFALFAGSRGYPLSIADFARVERRVAPWRQNVVHPLRRVRRRLKQQTDLPHKAVESLRRAVLAQEIESERQQQRMMEAVVLVPEGLPDARVAAENQLRYLEVSRVPASENTVADLATLLRETFTGLGVAGAKALLVNRTSAIDGRS